MNRLGGAFLADPKTYADIEADNSATSIAAVIVVLAQVFIALGDWMTGRIGVSLITIDERPLLEAMSRGLITGLAVWLLAAGSYVWAASTFFDRNISYVKMLRITGFVQVTLWVSIVPVLGPLSVFWTLWVLYRVLQMQLNLKGRQVVALLLTQLVVTVAIGIVIQLV